VDSLPYSSSPQLITIGSTPNVVKAMLKNEELRIYF